MKKTPVKKQPLVSKYKLATLVLFIIVVVPYLLEILIFRNKIHSELTNGEWGGFFGSYLGGIISGIGTLIAVWFTTKETRAIQDKTQDNIENDRKIQRKNQRKAFTDEIAQIVSEYIMDISGYYYANRHIGEEEYKRSLAVKNYYLLKIKLNGIDISSGLTGQLEIIHNHHSHGIVQIDEFNEIIENLMDEVALFIKNYVDYEQ